MEELLKVFLGTGIAGVCAFALAWLAREIFKHALNRDIESFKNKMQTETTVAIERLRADLQKTAVEHQVRYAKLHEKVAETVAEVYERLSKLARAVANYVSFIEIAEGPSKADRRVAAAEAFGELEKYYRPRRIYLPRDLAKKIDKLQGQLSDLSQDFMLEVEMPQAEGERGSLHKAWFK